LAPFVDQRTARRELERVVLEAGVPIEDLEHWILRASSEGGDYAGIYRHRPGSCALAVARYRAIVIAKRRPKREEVSRVKVRRASPVASEHMVLPPRDLLERLDASLRGRTARRCGEGARAAVVGAGWNETEEHPEISHIDRRTT
jgi:hypothetical protein